MVMLITTITNLFKNCFSVQDRKELEVNSFNIETLKHTNRVNVNVNESKMYVIFFITQMFYLVFLSYLH